MDVIDVYNAITSTNPSISKNDLCLLNENAPNSWTIRDKKNNEVWKIPKSGARKPDVYLLEKEALDRVPANINVIKYVREGLVSIAGRNYPYFVFPYVSGSKPLNEVIRNRKDHKKPFTSPEILEMGKSLVNMVHILYKSDVVHQDVKPGNILLKDNGDIYLLDLGIALFSEKDSHEIKKMQGPYAYLSPEKLDLFASLSNENKRRISFPSDLFSIGMILFEMATLKKLPNIMEPGDIRNAYLKLVELGVPDDLVELLSSLLNPNILERQQRVAKFFGIDWFNHKNKNKDVYLWLQHGSNGIEYLDQLLNVHIFTSDWGVIFTADQIRQQNNIDTFLERSKNVHTKGGKVAVDPCTYRLRFSDEHHSYLVNRDYGYIVSPGFFTKDILLPKGTKFVNEVLEFQKTFTPDIYIHPYFIIENLDDKWIDANFSSFNLSYDIMAKSNQAEQLYFGLFLAERFILNDNALDEVITQVLLNSKIKNIYLRLETCRSDSEPNKNPAYLLNVKRIIETLTKSKNVILGYSDVEALGWVGYGLDGIGINPDYGKRKTQVIDIMTKPKRPIPTPDKKQRYFAQKLFNDILTAEELRNPQGAAMGSGKELDCPCPFCNVGGKDMRLDPNQVRKHFIWHFEKYIKSMDGKTDIERIQIFQGMLTNAKNSYQYLQINCGMSFDKSTDGSFIPIWQTIFT